MTPDSLPTPSSDEQNASPLNGSAYDGLLPSEGGSSHSGVEGEVRHQLPPSGSVPDSEYVYKIRRRTIFIAVMLFVACCLSTFYVGSNLWMAFGYEGGFSKAILLLGGWSKIITNGLLYAVPVMLILLAHEMGHFLQAVRYGVPATPPFFIPMPIPPLGTMGAVIIQQRGVADRKSTFDIAISGPLAGLVFALPITWYAVLNSELLPKPAGELLVFGEPLILQWMIAAVHGPIAENMTVNVSPLGIAGWVGIFITALNLVPIGQLDGGHILYCLLGKRAHTIAQYLVGFAVGYMVATNNYTYVIMLALIVWIGTKHPPTANDAVPLGAVRIILGWLTLAFIIIGFTPVPLSMG